jgi:hypothetical protein
VRYWEQQSRPKLEILLRRTSIAPARPALLPLVDELLWELRQVGGSEPVMYRRLDYVHMHVGPGFIYIRYRTGKTGCFPS